MNTKTKQTSLGDLLLALRRKINESTKSNLLIQNLTFPQLEVLWFIGIDDKKSMDNISSYFKVSPPSATAMIEKMEQKGLVKRQRDAKDRRMVYIVLTTKTKKLTLSFQKQKEKILSGVIKKLSKKEKKELEKIIRILIED